MELPRTGAYKLRGGAGDRPGAHCRLFRCLSSQLAPGRHRREPSPHRAQVALEVTSAIPLQLHPSRECIKSLLQRDAPAADYSLIDGESPSTPTRRRSSSQGDDELPEAPRDVEHVAITLGFLAGALAVALSVRSLGKVLSLVGATGSTTISYILPGGIYWRVGPAGPKRYLAAGQFLLGCVIMPAALTFVFLK